MAVLLTKVDLCHEPWRSGHVTDTDLSCTYLGAAHSLPRRHGSPSDHLVHISRIFPAVIAGSAVYKGRGSIIRDEVTRGWLLDAAVGIAEASTHVATSFNGYTYTYEHVVEQTLVPCSRVRSSLLAPRSLRWCTYLTLKFTSQPVGHFSSTTSTPQSGGQGPAKTTCWLSELREMCSSRVS